MVSRLFTGKWIGEVLAPSYHSDLEDLKSHFTSIKEFYIDRREDDEGARITDHVHQIVKILLEERGREEVEGQTPRGSTDTSPCMEYFLQAKILEVLCVLGEQDIPPGMLKVTLMAISTLLRNMPVHIFHQMSVNHPISALIVNCRGHLHPDEVDDYIDLIMTLFIVLTSDPSLVDFFLVSRGADGMDFVPFSGLLVYFNEEGTTGTKARQTLLFCLKHLACERPVLDYLLNSSSCIPLMVEEMVSRYRCLPQSAVWSPATLQKSPELESFLTHCHFCSDLVAAAPKAIARTFLDKLETDLLTSVLGPALLHPNENVTTISTFYLSKMLSGALHGRLLESLVFFILGDSTTAEEEDSVSDDLLRSSLIRRINSCSERSAVATLRLFETLVGLHNEPIIFNLVLRNLVSMKHIAEENRSADQLKEHLVRVRVVCESFCRLYPASEAMADGLPAYLYDARDRVENCKRACASWEGDAARRASRSTSSSAALDDVPFFEGEFLRAVYNRLQNFADNSLEVNLLLTSILSRMAGYPHPILHTYLVDPFLPVAPGVRTVYSIVESLSKAIRTNTCDINNLTEVLQAVRSDLGGEASAVRPIELTDELRAVLVSALLLQEFCKEMASTAFFVWWCVYKT